MNTMTKITRPKIDYNKPIREYLSEDALIKLRECLDKLIKVDIK